MHKTPLCRSPERGAQRGRVSLLLAAYRSIPLVRVDARSCSAQHVVDLFYWIHTQAETGGFPVGGRANTCAKEKLRLPCPKPTRMINISPYDTCPITLGAPTKYPYTPQTFRALVESARTPLSNSFHLPATTTPLFPTPRPPSPAAEHHIQHTEIGKSLNFRQAHGDSPRRNRHLSRGISLILIE